MILVTGAAGKTGRAVIQALLDRGQAVRALVHRPADTLAVPAVVGNMQNQETWAQAMAGISAVYHICPNMSPNEVSIGQLAIEAARSAGVTHFVYHSVLHPQIEAMPHHWLKLRVEEMLFASGLSFTVLQPAAYMQNLLANWLQIVHQGIYPVPYAAEARLSLVDLTDVAAAAAVVLSQPGHAGAVYELAGTYPLAQTEVAAVLSRQLGRDVTVEVTPLARWRQQAAQAGLSGYQLETLLKMFNYYDRYGLAGNPNLLTWLLGRPPVSLSDFAARTIGQIPT